MKAPSFILKMRKTVDKSIPGMSVGFNDPTTWLDTGCYLLNYLVSNRFDGGIPLEGKMTMFAGDSGSGKSYIASANLIKAAHAQGIYVILIDTENSLDKSWLEKLDVNTDEEVLTKISGATVDDCALLLSTAILNYKEDHASKPYAQRPKLLIIIDSLGMLITPNMEKQFNEGELKGDMGIKAKQITAMVRVAMAMIASQPIGLVVTNHVYDSQDEYSPDTISGGKMLEFASSVIVQMNKYLLREDEFGKKLTDGKVDGIKSTVVVRKSRYAKPFEKLKILIPYDTGMNKYSGLFDLFYAKGIFKKAGKYYEYTSPVTGEVQKQYKRDFKPILDQIMQEWEHWENVSQPVGFDETGATGEEEDED